MSSRRKVNLNRETNSVKIDWRGGRPKIAQSFKSVSSAVVSKKPASSLRHMPSSNGHGGRACGWSRNISSPSVSRAGIADDSGLRKRMLRSCGTGCTHTSSWKRCRRVVSKHPQVHVQQEWIKMAGRRWNIGNRRADRRVQKKGQRPYQMVVSILRRQYTNPRDRFFSRRARCWILFQGRCLSPIT